MDHFGSPAHASTSVITSIGGGVAGLGGSTPSSHLSHHHSIGGPGSLMMPGSTGGPASVFGGGNPGSVLGAFPHSHDHRVGGPHSHLNPGSVINLGGGASSLALDLGPASNLAVPMTPLAAQHDRDAHDMYANPLPSNIHTVQPFTPASNADVPRPQLQNIVSTVNLGVPLDLKAIALHARNAEYNPKRFAAVIMRIREPRTTALIFSSGKMVCTGAKSEESSRLAARKYARIVQKLGFNAKFTEFKVQNMVGSCDVRFPIQLEGLCLTHAQFSTYEPELFPGLIYRMVKPRVVLLIFVSGKVVITGAKFKRDIDDAFHQIYPILKGFKK